MSAHRTIFLTENNEHCYDDCLEARYDRHNVYKGNAIVLELDKSHCEVIHNNETDLIIQFNDPDSQIYKLIASLKDNKIIED